MTKREKLAEAHRLIAQAMSVPQMSVEAEQKLNKIANEAANGR